MRLSRASVWLCSILSVLLSAAAAAQTTFSTVVVFGDSLSDTGNVAHLVQNANPLGIRYPSDRPDLGFDYTDGRFTDGADTQPAAQAYFGVWIEQLAASFPGKPAVKNSLDGGTNYAYGDATTQDGTTPVSDSAGPISITVTLHNMGQQVTDYLSTNPTPNAQTLYVLWGGGNDIYNDPTSAAAAADREMALVLRLMAVGATNFMLPNYPPLGGVPNYATTAQAAALNAASATFAQELAKDVVSLKMTASAQAKTINIYQPDIFSLFGTAATNPMSVGLGNVTAKAQNISASPDTYLIWDGLHPTTTGHHLAAAAAANLLTPLVASGVVLSVPSAALDAQKVTLTATVTSTASKAVPTGLVTFFNGKTAVGSAALNASGVGTAILTIAASASPYSLTAVYAGDTTFNVSASTAQPLTVPSAAVGTTTTVSADNTSPGTGQKVTFTATVAPAVSTYGTPPGTVTFLDGTTTLGTGTLSNGTATYATTTLAAGAHSITATYPGSGVFAGSTSAVLSETVVAPTFTPAASPATLTIASGSSGTTQLSAASVGGYTGTLTLGCGTLPAHISCSFSAPTYAVTSGSTPGSPVTLTIATNATSMAALELPGRPGAWAAPRVLSATLLFPGMATLLFAGLRRRRLTASHLRLLSLAALLSVGAVLGLAGCGSSNNAARGTYTVPVTFTPATGSSGSAQTLNVSVTVQ